MNQGINKTLGLPEDYSIGFNDAMTVLERFKDATFGSTKPISNISFIYYHDKFGNFLKPKKHIDVIVKKMFDNLPINDQFMLLTYFSNED